MSDDVEDEVEEFEDPSSAAIAKFEQKEGGLVLKQRPIGGPAEPGNQRALKFDDNYKILFLTMYRKVGFLRETCRRIKINHQTVYHALKEDADFQQAYDDVKGEWTEQIEREVYRRAIDGVDKPVIQGGKMIMIDYKNPKTGEVESVPLILTEYSDRLLEFLARATMPEKYGNKVKIEATQGTGVLMVQDTMSPDDFEAEMAAQESGRVERLQELDVVDVESREVEK